jgi:hypothetical protein
MGFSDVCMYKCLLRTTFPDVRDGEGLEDSNLMKLTMQQDFVTYGCLNTSIYYTSQIY